MSRTISSFANYTLSLHDHKFNIYNQKYSYESNFIGFVLYPTSSDI